jgi:VWFA-related protein
VIRVDVDVVNLYATVRDKRGALIPNLTAADFVVKEDGQEQKVAYFNRETDIPLTIGLLVDVSGSQVNLIDVEKRTASAFFSQVLRPKDMAFLMSFGSDVELMQDRTNSGRALERALNDLRVRSDPSGMMPGPVPTISKPRGTVMFDAVYLAADEILKQEVGRKTIILITDGVDMGSRVDIREALEAAQKADTIIYSIYYVDPSAYGGGRGYGYYAPSDGDLKRLSEETGGRLFKVSRKNTLEDIFQQLQEELRSQYALGYSPTNTVRDGSFRKVEVKTANKDYRVQARKGYFADANR